MPVVDGGAQPQIPRIIAEHVLSSSNAIKALGVTLLRVSEGAAEAEMGVQEHMLNAQRLCHGGTLYALADVVSALAFLTSNELGVTQTATVSFLAPAHEEDKLIARGVLAHRSGRTAVVDAEVVGHTGTILIARSVFRSLGRPVLGHEEPLPDEGKMHPRTVHTSTGAHYAE
jgi:phenylacetic acid degradation protein PaaD